MAATMHEALKVIEAFCNACESTAVDDEWLDKDTAMGEAYSQGLAILQAAGWRDT